MGVKEIKQELLAIPISRYDSANSLIQQRFTPIPDGGSKVAVHTHENVAILYHEFTVEGTGIEDDLIVGSQVTISDKPQPHSLLIEARRWKRMAGLEP